MKFGEKLRILRLKKQLTQQELAKIVGLGSNTISNYEQGKTYPHNREVYSQLAAILVVTVETLYNENDVFVEEAQIRYGYSGKKQADQLVKEIGGLFAGGTLSDDDLDGVMRTLQEYYWKAKEENKKYASKKRQK
jgi:transcriptional regulator with XRE-family HTH domain